MAIILKPLFEILTGDIAICNNVLYNYIFLVAVGEFAYHISYGVVGNLYSSAVITGRSAGSVVHWIVRLLIYFFAAYMLRALIWIYTFVISVPIQIWWALSGIFLICLILLVVFRIFKRVESKQLPEKN